MGSKKAKKTTKNVLRNFYPHEWEDAVSAVADDDRTPSRPPKVTITAVASVFARYADFEDGTSCWPSRQTVAARAGVRRDTVSKVTDWFISQGLMVKVRTRRNNVSEFDLVIPSEGSLVDPLEDQPISPEVVPREDQPKPGVDPLVDPLVVPLEAHNLLPPTGGKEEGGAAAPPDGAAAAPQGYEEHHEEADGIARNIRDRSDHPVVRPAVIEAIARLLADGAPPQAIEDRAVKRLEGSNGNGPVTYVVRYLNSLNAEDFTVAEHLQPAWEEFGDVDADLHYRTDYNGPSFYQRFKRSFPSLDDTEEFAQLPVEQQHAALDFMRELTQEARQVRRQLDDAWDAKSEPVEYDF